MTDPAPATPPTMPPRPAPTADPSEFFDLPRLDSLSLDQFRGTLITQFVAIDVDALPDRLKALLPDIKRVLTTEDFEWNDAYCAEKLLSRFMLPAALEVEIARQIDFLAPLDAEAQGLYQKRFAELSGKAAGKSYDDPETRSLQALLERLLNDLHWTYSQRFQKRMALQAYAARVAVLSMIIAGVFLAVLMVSGSGWLSWTGFAGLEVAVAAGFVGSSFSVITGVSPTANANTLEDMRRMASRGVILLRMAVGGLAATILYFFFEASLIEGMLFPNLDLIGFAAVDSAEGIGALVKAAVEAVPSDASSDALTRAVEEAVRESAAQAAPVQPVGSMVPNAELSKLLVWGFVAGFSEKFVQSVLGRVETSGDAPK